MRDLYIGSNQVKDTFQGGMEIWNGFDENEFLM